MRRHSNETPRLRLPALAGREPDAILTPTGVVSALHSTTRSGVLYELSEAVARRVARTSVSRLYDAISEREELCPTGLAGGVAIPHGRIEGLPGVLASFGISHGGVDFGAADRQPATLVMAVFAPAAASAGLIKVLARACRVLSSPLLCAALRAGTGAHSVVDMIAAEEQRLDRADLRRVGEASEGPSHIGWWMPPAVEYVS